MLITHFIVMVVISLIFTLISVLKNNAGPIPPFIAFVSWISAAYQSIAVEIPTVYSGATTISYEVYSGGAALGLYFLSLASIMFVYFVWSAYRMMGER